MALTFLSTHADHLVAGTPPCAGVPPGSFRGKLPEAILRVFLGEGDFNKHSVLGPKTRTISDAGTESGKLCVSPKSTL